MALSSWMLRKQMLGPQGRRFNIRPSHKNKEEDLFGACLKQDTHESFKNILSKLFDEDTEEKVHLMYLNTLVKLLLHYEKNAIEINFNRKDILCCLRVSLVHESTIIRSAGLRCIRHTIKAEDDVVYINSILIPFLITRSLDLVQKNDVERVEAMKLTRKMLTLAPNHFDICMVKSLVSLANEGSESKDRMLRISLATLSEIGLLNTTLFIESGGVAAITRNLIDCQIPTIAESLCGLLLLLLDRPQTRKRAAIDLHSIAAPFCDFHYKHGWKDKTRDEREMRLNCSRLALLTILRSWPGVLHFCNPRDEGGFRAIVEILYLNQLEVRKAVLDLLYDLLGLPQPEWSDELSVALSAIDPCEAQSSWRLKEGFVAAEGRAVLPHLAQTRPSPIEMHLALLLQTFLECGLLGALTEVIISSDTFISVRATILLAELLRLIQLLLPPGCSNLSPSLPTLLDYASRNKPQAMDAVTALLQLHKLMKRRPASYSVHLDYIMRNSTSKRSKNRHDRNSRHKGFKSKLNQVKSVLKDGDDIVKETGVLASNDALSWNWDLIKVILKANRVRLDLTESSHKIFVKRLLEFYTPSQNKYSHMDLGTAPGDSFDLTTSGIDLVNYLVELKQPEFQCMVLDLFKDIQAQIQAITNSRSVHDCLFSPAHMVNTHCQSYFLFIGQFSRSESGLWILNSIDMFSMLKTLATTTRHDSYVKLIISSLDYASPGPSRDILEAVLNCEVESSRLYATQFMLVLLRVKSPSFASWAIRLLVKRLEDESRKVSLSALATLHEACELPDCLDALTDLNPNLSELGEKGELLQIRILSTEKGFKKIGKDKVLEIISKWDTYMNFRYIKLVEGEISDALTLHQRNEDGKYDKRVSSASGARNSSKKDVFLPQHLYGQLNEHDEGFKLLTSNGAISTFVELIQKGSCSSDDEIVKLKAAIWAASHMSTSNRGIEFLNRLGFVDNLVKLVNQSPVYAVKSTAYYGLGLVATTSAGADELSLSGWLTTRHNRHDQWPVIHEEVLDAFFLSYFAASLHESDNPINASGDKVTNGGSTTNGESQDDHETLVGENETLILYPTSPDIRKLKQWTLPASRTPTEVFHVRSLSESKTFDTSNGLDDNRISYDVPVRQRNTSMTESTTSGVSSCDSLPNKQGGGPNYLQTLSPIPSSTSLSVLKLSPQVKRYSHRVSSNSAGSEASTSSFTGSAANELNLQNMLGYQTIRYIRRRDHLNFYRTERDDYLFRPPPELNRCQPSELSRALHYASFRLDVFESVYEPSRNHKPRDAVYMGICLPKSVVQIYPDDIDVNYANTTILKEESLRVTMSPKLQDKDSKSSVKVWKHWKESCLYCSQLQLSPVVSDFGNDPVKTEILKITERLSNPVLNKPFRTQLLRLKQKDPKAFKDVCVYSEVCRLFSESNYSLVTRRMLHELFLDVACDRLLDGPRKILGIDPKQKSAGRKSTGDIVVISTEFKTLDSLKLISAENKFPIRTRKNTN